MDLCICPLPAKGSLSDDYWARYPLVSTADYQHKIGRNYFIDFLFPVSRFWFFCSLIHPVSWPTKKYWASAPSCDLGLKLDQSLLPQARDTGTCSRRSYRQDGLWVKRFVSGFMICSTTGCLVQLQKLASSGSASITRVPH